MSFPAKVTEPLVGLSSPPSKCMKVVLPAPEAPTIAIRAPAEILRLTSLSTSTLPRSVIKLFDRDSTAIIIWLFISERFGRVHFCGPPCRINCRHQGNRHRNNHDCEHIAGIDDRREVVHTVNALVENLDVEEVFQSLDKRIGIPGQE